MPIDLKLVQLCTRKSFRNRAREHMPKHNRRVFDNITPFNAGTGRLLAFVSCSDLSSRVMFWAYSYEHKVKTNQQTSSCNNLLKIKSIYFRDVRHYEEKDICIPSTLNKNHPPTNM